MQLAIFYLFHVDGGIPTSKSHISSSPYNCKLQKDCRINSDTLGMVLHCSHMFFVILVPCHKARKSRLRFVLSARRNRLGVAKRHKLPRLLVPSLLPKRDCCVGDGVSME